MPLTRTEKTAAEGAFDGDDLRRLQRMRWIATGSLGTAALVYAVASFAPPVWAVSAIRAAAEAAMVGGIADWYAVVALFKRPLGLPIPHTGIIPAKKDRIGASLGHFVQDHLLDPDEIVKRVELVDASALIAEWLRTEAHVHALAEDMATALRAWLAFHDDESLKMRVKTVVRGIGERAELTSVVNDALAALLERGEHFVVTDAVAAAALDWLQAERPRIEARITDHAAQYAASYLRGSILDIIGMKPDQVAGKLISPKDVRDIADGIVQELSRYLLQVRQPGSEIRETIHGLICTRLEELQTSEAWAMKLASLRDAFLDHAEFDVRFEAAWTGLRAQLVEAVSSDDVVVAEISESFKRIADLIATNDAWRAAINERLLAAVRTAISHYRQQAASYVTDTVNGWSGETLSRVVEQKIGRELQFVRINGTLVGALVGLAIFVLTSLMSPS